MDTAVVHFEVIGKDGEKLMRYYAGSSTGISTRRR